MPRASALLVGGPRAVRELLDGAPDAVERLFFVPRTPRLTPLLRRAEALGIPTETLPRRTLDEMAGGIRHQGLLARCRPYRYRTLDELLRSHTAPWLLALDGITDPHNLGAIVRSAVALGVDGLVVPERRSAPVTPTVARTSAGAVFHARIARVVNLARALTEMREHGLQTIGLDVGAHRTLEETLAREAPRGRVLVVGSEGKGLRRLVRERCESLAAIPLHGPVASLNASVAAAIALYEASRHRPAGG